MPALGRKMKRSLFAWFLIAMVVGGGVMAWRTGRERSRLTARHERLVKSTGELSIKDASKIYALALDTGEPLHFAWHFYFPPNCKQRLRCRFGNQLHSMPASAPSQADSIGRVRFGQDDDGTMELFFHFGPVARGMSLEDSELEDLLRGRWDQVKVEQLGAPGVAVVDPDQPAVLLRITLPEDLQTDARTKLSAENQRLFVPVVFEVMLGPPPL
jgi:hypothetical protein